MRAAPELQLTAQRLVERSLSTWGRRIAVVEGIRRVTYETLEKRTARLANVLLAAQASVDHPAATLLPNTLEFIEADVACTRAGITRLGISERLSADESRYLLADSQAAVLVTTRSLLEPLDDDLPDSIRLVVLVGDDASEIKTSAPSVLYEQALASASDSLTATLVSPAAPNYIMYTSGTTGRPKGATHTHGGRAASALNMLASELSFHSDPVMVHAGPLTHGSGSKLISFFATGGTNVVLPAFTAEALADAVASEHGTHTFLVPTMIQRLLEASDKVIEDVSALEQISFGGSPISAALFRRAIERLGPILTQVYGSSEAPHPITLLRPNDYRNGETPDAVLTSAGRAAYGIDIKSVDKDGADALGKELGELMIRSPNLMCGYWHNDDATSEVMTPDGWYCTGDIATIDDAGFVTFQDRKRDLIISGGLNVYPSEVERVIAAHPRVREVAVVGAPDEEWGEAVVAYVVARDNELRDAEIIDWTRERLAHYKKPRRVVFLNELPLGSSNKVLKRELRQALWEGRDRQVN